MCNKDCINFVASRVHDGEIFGRRILEVGSRDVNGSVRPAIEALKPREYIGIDIERGIRVDRLINALDILNVFGENSFDVVISTEMLEHVEDWRTIINNMKRVLIPGGIIYITTRSEGFKYHNYPHDFWRYSIKNTKAIFSDFEQVEVVPDPSCPGVFVKARKPLDFHEIDLSGIELSSSLKEKRT